MQIPTIVGAGLIVIGAGLGIGKIGGSAMDAIARSIETTIGLSKDAGIETKDCLRYANRNRITHAITNGKISPWMLYQSTSGIEFIEDLDEGQQRLIIDYINPEQWAIRFKRYPENVFQVKELLNAAGY